MRKRSGPNSTFDGLSHSLPYSLIESMAKLCQLVEDHELCMHCENQVENTIPPSFSTRLLSSPPGSKSNRSPSGMGWACAGSPPDFHLQGFLNPLHPPAQRRATQCHQPPSAARLVSILLAAGYHKWQKL